MSISGGNVALDQGFLASHLIHDSWSAEKEILVSISVHRQTTDEDNEVEYE